jgi:hypothetical protein
MRLSYVLVPVALLFILIFSACRSKVTAEMPNPVPSVNTVNTPKPANTHLPSTPEISMVEQTPAENVSSVPRELAEKAKEDLANYLHIDVSQIRVVESRSVDWPDASLGCPQPGMTYAQVITPGYWIVLEASGKQYPYHTDMGGQVILCVRGSSDSSSETPPLPLIPINPTEIKDGQPWVPVD